MCLQTKWFNSRALAIDARNNPEIAKRDIPVWKVINKKTNRSPYWQKLKYEKGFRHSEKKLGIKLYRDGSYYRLVISIGLHACTTRMDAEAHAGFEDKIVKMYIPKGSIYFNGIFGDIVSTDLTWY